ncbi:hypothetical protein FNV43_RR23362 [Rhamnella rubrinervis]|uniref:Bifunctional inhibitor/plant lipid transfer protein/seed storage helical domain-containing protein n=1 Tax=Rhamnella rubrinervis TaxID=2594499 RepID=A0A8K0GVX8_9ROSA|nr:hypothetical protein FNV43_RR23362 [Rhamnella rubrinervis]
MKVLGVFQFIAIISAALVVISVHGQTINTPCTASMISSFTPCLNFITGSSSNGPSSPTTGCCNSLKSMMSGSRDCFCLLVTANVPLQLPINRTLAISLPRSCNMEAIPIQCQASGSPLPAPGPVLPPAASPDEESPLSPQVSKLSATAPAPQSETSTELTSPGSPPPIDDDDDDESKTPTTRMVAALDVREANADDVFSAKYKECFNSCEKECKDGGQGYTFCEMKCDADCGAKEIADVGECYCYKTWMSMRAVLLLPSKSQSSSSASNINRRERQKKDRAEHGEQGLENYYPTEERSQEQQQQQENPYFYENEDFETLVKTEEGRIQVLPKFTDSSESLQGIENYRLGFLEANPHAFVMPAHLDADSVYLVVQGNVILT